MHMGIGQLDLAILMPAFAAAWNLAGGQTLLAPQKASRRVYRSPDGFFTIEAPAGWAMDTEEEANELTFVNGDVSVNVAAVKTNDGDTVDQILEINKGLLRHLCPSGEIWSEGAATVADAPGAYFTMFCPSARARTIVRISAAHCQKRILIFKMSAPCAELHSVQAAIDQMMASIKATGGLPNGREPRRIAC
jgi:hypothetical protein